MEQKQYQGPDRRQSQSQEQYQGEERRKPDPLFDEPAVTPASTPGMSTQERKDEQERKRQQQEKHDDQL